VDRRRARIEMGLADEAALGLQRHETQAFDDQLRGEDGHAGTVAAGAAGGDRAAWTRAAQA
jgi:hypothetical protein